MLSGRSTLATARAEKYGGRFLSVVLFSSQMQTRPPFAIKMDDYWWVSQMSHL